MPLLPAENRVTSWQTNSNTGLISDSDLLNNVKLTAASKLATRIGEVLQRFRKKPSLRESNGFKKTDENHTG